MTTTLQIIIALYIITGLSLNFIALRMYRLWDENKITTPFRKLVFTVIFPNSSLDNFLNNYPVEFTLKKEPIFRVLKGKYSKIDWNIYFGLSVLFFPIRIMTIIWVLLCIIFMIVESTLKRVCIIFFPSLLSLKK